MLVTVPDLPYRLACLFDEQGLGNDAILNIFQIIGHHLAFEDTGGEGIDSEAFTSQTQREIFNQKMHCRLTGSIS